LTVKVLKALKGEGGAARLVDLCTVAELPPTITGFLGEIYQRYPKPKRRPTDTGDATAVPEAVQDKSAVVAGD
jgi:putative ATP-dependent endonuclease of OLD family